MDRPLDRLTARLREQPFAVDALFAGAAFFLTVVLPADSAWSSPVGAFVIGVLLTAPLAWRRRAPVPAAAVVLGLTRGQLRGLLAWEAVLIAGVAAVLGVLVGGAYGLIGAASALGEVGTVVIDVPGLQIGAIVAVATAAGLLASVLPARRAARISPVAAIAG